MRLHLGVIPAIGFVFLPFVSYFNEWSFCKISFSTLFLLAIKLLFVSANLSKRKKKSTILETIHASHYVEKVRWCMDYIGLEYVEEQNVGILGAMFLGRLVPTLKISNSKINIENSSDILRYLFGKFKNDPEIELFLNPSEEALKLEEELDEFGIVVREFCYGSIFQAKNKFTFSMKVWGMYQSRIPIWQKICLILLVPLLILFVATKLNISKGSAKTSEDQMDAALKKYDEMLSDGRKFLLKTEKPTFVDFHFASMLGILLFLKEFGGKAIDDQSRPDLDVDCPEDVRKKTHQLRESPSGQFVIRMFNNYRFKKINHLKKE